MNLSTLLSILCFVAFPFLIFAQEPTNYLDLKELSLQETDTNQLLFFCRKTNDEFTSKGHSVWEKSILLTTTKDTFAVSAKINLLKDEIEIFVNNAPCVLFQEKMLAIAIKDKVYIKSQYPDKDQLFLSYFELISEGKTSLLLKNGNTFFYKKEDQPAQELTKSKKAIYAIFKDRRTEVEKFISSNKLNPKKEEDLLRIFFFMNQ